jgi:hypothetical protein
MSARRIVVEFQRGKLTAKARSFPRPSNFYRMTKVCKLRGRSTESDRNSGAGRCQNQTSSTAVGTLNLGLGPTRFPLQWTRFLLQYATRLTCRRGRWANLRAEDSTSGSHGRRSWQGSRQSRDVALQSFAQHKQRIESLATLFVALVIRAQISRPRRRPRRMRASRRRSGGFPRPIAGDATEDGWRRRRSRRGDGLVGRPPVHAAWEASPSPVWTFPPPNAVMMR